MTFAIWQSKTPEGIVFRRLYALAVALTLIALWGLTHRYEGLVRDGELYALQALARLQPNLGSDLYLQFTSQDRYTVFSALYAELMRLVGLQSAGVILFVTSYTAFMLCAWLLSKKFFGSICASVSVVMLIALPGYYGAYRIFAYAEGFLTARSLAEASVVAALTLHFYGRRRLALAIAIASMSMHPLMTLPGLITLVCLHLRSKVASSLLITGIAATLGLSLIRIAPMDQSWLEVVQERSQFLFLEHWRAADWETAARPVVALVMTSLVLHESGVRRLCHAAAAVALSGLAVAWIGGSIGPSSLLVQGQAWRWEWIAVFISILFLAPTALRAWRTGPNGPVCAVLSLLAWTSAPVYGLACGCSAVILWVIGLPTGRRAATYVRWSAWALTPFVFSQAAVELVTVSRNLLTQPSNAASLLEALRADPSINLVPTVAALALVACLRCCRSIVPVGAIVTGLVIAVAIIVPNAFEPHITAGTPGEIAEFKEWRDAIPPDSAVLLLPPKKSAAFVWFSLMRPSYLSVDQSSGVVFSSATAAEVRRRSEVLLPVGEPDWRILSQFKTKSETSQKTAVPAKLLTAESLRSICSDQKLGFVITENDVGLFPIKQNRLGPWRNWNLYNCQHVRTSDPSA